MEAHPLFSPCGADIASIFRPNANDVFIASAFLRIEAVSELLGRLLDGRCGPGSLRVLTRALPIDIATGASDLESLRLLATAKHPLLTIEIRRDPRLHAKAYLVDGRDAIVSSANLTPSGLLKNIELGLRIRDDGLVGAIQSYFDPIWNSAQVIDDRVLLGLHPVQQSENSPAPETMDSSEQPPQLPRPFAGKDSLRIQSLAPLPKKSSFILNAGRSQLERLGLKLTDSVAVTLPDPSRRSSPSSARRAEVRSRHPTRVDLPSPDTVRAMTDVTMLRKLIKAFDWELRDAAAEALGNLPGDEPTVILMDSLSGESDRDVLWAILLSLRGRVTCDQLQTILQNQQKHDDEELTFATWQIAAAFDPLTYATQLIRSVPDLEDDDAISEIRKLLGPIPGQVFVTVLVEQLPWASTPEHREFLAQLAAGRSNTLRQLLRENSNDKNIVSAAGQIAAAHGQATNAANFIRSLPDLDDNEALKQVLKLVQSLSNDLLLSVLWELRAWASTQERRDFLVSLADGRSKKLRAQLADVVNTKPTASLT